MIYRGYEDLKIDFWKLLGGKTQMFDALTSTLGSINWEVIFQLVSIGLIVIAVAVVIFVLAFRNGNL